MAPSTIRLTVYGIKPVIHGHTLTDFDDVIHPATVSEGQVEQYGPIGDGDFQAKLYLMRPEPRRPDWMHFLQQGFPDINVSECGSPRAALLARLRENGIDHYFAFTFGLGRFLLRAGSYQRHFGREVAVRSVDLERVLRVRTKTLSGRFTIRHVRQANVEITLDDFEVQHGNELLESLTGSSREDWFNGRRVSGNDAVSVITPAVFDILKATCQEIVRLRREVALPAELRWTKDFEIVTDPDLIDVLSRRVLALTKREDRSRHTLDLAPPMVDLDRAAAFRFSFQREREYDDVSLTRYVAGLRDADQLAGLDLDGLRSGHYVEAIDTSGGRFEAWPVFHCLYGEMTHDRKRYVLDDGDFYLIHPDYLRALNEYVNGLPDYRGALPGDRAQWDEAEYTRRAAESGRGYLALHGMPVRLPYRTSPVEMCDILTPQGEFMHVKRTRHPCSFSNLFAKGFESAQQIARNPEAGIRVGDLIREAVRAKGGEGPSEFEDLIEGLRPDGISPGEYTVVYVIITTWNGHSPAEVIPFFSKVDLRRYAEELRALGYKVVIKRVQEARRRRRRIRRAERVAAAT